MHRRPVHLAVMAVGYPLLLILSYLLGPQQLPPLLRALQTRHGYSTVREQVNQYLYGRKGHYAVYFQDLASGATWGINEDQPLPPASLIKVPVVLCLYQQVAAGKLHWEDRIGYNKADFQKGDGAIQYTVREGDSYSLRTLATVSITISDNIAHNMLVRFLGKEKLLGFMKGYGVIIDRPYGGAPTTARGLGNVLAGVAEFNRRNPEPGGRLLDDLAHTIFHVGLPVGFPPGFWSPIRKEVSTEWPPIWGSSVPGDPICWSFFRQTSPAKTTVLTASSIFPSLSMTFSSICRRLGSKEFPPPGRLFHSLSSTF